MTTKNSNFDDFIKSKIAQKGTPYTHTRIGDKELKIYGGSYAITDEDNETFLNRYHQKVFVEGKLEYLTEKQLIVDGPLLIDIDLRYKTTIQKKQHTTEHIIDGVMCYADKIEELLDITNNSEIDVFVMEKNDVNKLEDKTKDGIHIIFGLQLHKGIQTMLRKRIIPELENIWGDLPITNTWEDVIDEGVTKGFVNWQVYGSRKPGNKAYLIKHHYTLLYNDSDWSIQENDINAFDTKKYLHKMSARCNSHPKFSLKDKHIEEFTIASKSLGRHNKHTLVVKKPNVNVESVPFDKINSAEILDGMIATWLDNISTTDYKLKETHQYTLALPESYYGAGSYNKWLRVGWALANINKKMFLTWVKFSSQSKEFDWNDVSNMFDMWNGFDTNNPDGLTNRSIMYWCKIDAREKYKQIHKETIDFFIEQTVQTATEFDLATVLFNIYKDRFVCVSIKNNCWYEYINHRWFEIDSGNTLRLCISRDMHDEYIKRIHEISNRTAQMDHSDESYENLRKIIGKMSEICVLLKKTTWKNNIMREAKELFYNQDFINKLDQNPYLLCFNNYVVDFKTKVYRKGQPDDYISKCTNIDYIPLDVNKHSGTISEINTFIDELFPNEKLRTYMWDHLASCLVGTNENQSFNIYNGSGRNGKSKLVDLMSKGLGDYKGTVPITLITQKRNSIGSTSSEIVQLMGTRYAVMQEPSKGDQINEGIMKEITGGDPIQGRALFKDTVTFMPQFKLVVCTNTLFDIKSNDDGTWRRIRVCDFESKFIENPYEDEQFSKEVYPYQFKIDKKIDEKFNRWAPIFMSMLVERSYKSQGNVGDCSIVMASSNQYREGQDYLAEFVKDKIQKKIGSKVKKTELLETFKQWYTTNYGRAIPKGRELYEFMDRRFGKYNNQGWHNVAIIYDDDEGGDVIDEC